MRATLAAVCAAAALAAAAAAPPMDFVPSLPTFGAPPQDTYSGYLNVSTSAKRLHYLFVRAQSNAADAPVVLWLNGGPGCSSLDGYFYEHGPQHVDNAGALYTNPHSWNRYANMLYMEAPAGVGYSYSTDPADYVTNDEQTADDNYHALQSFFTEKFPELAGNPLVISGESYGGTYVPTLTVRILEGNANKTGVALNLKGFIVGNGVNEFNTNSLIEYVYYHGFIGSALWGVLQANCDGKYANPPNEACANAVNEASNVVYSSGLNFYGWNLQCHHNAAMDERQQRSAELLFPGLGLPAKAAARAAELGESVPCINSTAGHEYLNRPDVRAALHIPGDLPPWSICTTRITYTKTVHAIAPYWSKALSAGLHFTNYAGDTDMACNFLGNEQTLASLNLTPAGPTAPWHTNGQVAGFMTAFKEGADFWTVKGSGHMVPQFRPSQALVMFRTALMRTGVLPSNTPTPSQEDDNPGGSTTIEAPAAALRGAGLSDSDDF